MVWISVGPCWTGWGFEPSMTSLIISNGWGSFTIYSDNMIISSLATVVINVVKNKTLSFTQGTRRTCWIVIILFVIFVYYCCTSVPYSLFFCIMVILEHIWWCYSNTHLSGVPHTSRDGKAWGGKKKRTEKLGKFFCWEHFKRVEYVLLRW